MGIRQAVNRHWAIASAIGIGAFIAVIAVVLLTVVPTNDNGPGGSVGTNRTVMADDRFETMLASGDLHEMLQQHQQMMETMRTDTGPSMITRMDNDPMWQMLKSGELVKLMEEHQKAIDQMLGK